MAKINGSAFTEKGALKPIVRETIMSDMLPKTDVALSAIGFTYNEDKKTYSAKFVDNNGKEVYFNLAVSVGKNPADKADKKPSKKKATVAETITISND